MRRAKPRRVAGSIRKVSPRRCQASDIAGDLHLCLPLELLSVLRVAFVGLC